MGVRRIAPALGCLLVAAATGVRAGGPAFPPAAPAAVAWRELKFAGHKAGISAAIDLRLGHDPVRPADEILVESTTHLPGRTFAARERLDSVGARAREIVDTETGARHHRKTYTLGERGFLLDLVEPASLPELLLPPERWTKRSASFTAYPRALPAGATVTGPAGLLYAASAAGLSAPGDSLTIHVLVQAHVERVTVWVEGAEPFELAFDENTGGEVRAVRGQLTALRLVARSQPVDSASASAFRIFGLEGNVEILWDPGRRLPVEISGHVKLLGQVEVRLASVTLR